MPTVLYAALSFVSSRSSYSFYLMSLQTREVHEFRFLGFQIIYISKAFGVPGQQLRYNGGPIAARPAFDPCNGNKCFEQCPDRIWGPI